MKNKEFTTKFLAFTFFFAIGIYLLMIGFLYWTGRKDDAAGLTESCCKRK